MAVIPAAVHAQATNSNVWLEGGGLVWGCGNYGYETLRIRASGGRFYCLSEHQRNTWSQGHPLPEVFKCEPARVKLALNTALSGTANQLQIDAGSGWSHLSATPLEIRHGLKTIRVRAKPNADIPCISEGRERSKGFATSWDFSSSLPAFHGGEHWVFRLEPVDGEEYSIIGPKYMGDPSVAFQVVVPNSPNNGCNPVP